MLPGRYYSPKRSGQGWDFFWYGNSLEAGSTASNDKLFVTFYTYEQRGGDWAPAWYGATFDPAQPGNAGLGFSSELVGGVPVRTEWNGVLYRYNQASFAGGYGPIRQSDPSATTPSGQAAQQVGKVKLYFGSDGISSGQRPDKAAVKWSLTASTLHPSAPATPIEDCLGNVLTGNQTGPSVDAGYVGVWGPQNSASGWFWTPIFWNFNGVENEHHLVAYFDANGLPSWIIGGANPSVCFVNGQPAQPYPSAEIAPNKAVCAMRSKGYTPWHTLCSFGGSPCSNWNSENYQFRVGKMVRGAWSVSPLGINRTQFGVVRETGQRNPANTVILDQSELSVAMAPPTGGYPAVPRAPFNGMESVSQLTGFTRIRVEDTVDPTELTSCTVAQGGSFRKPGLCDVRVHFMTEGAHPNMVIVRRRTTGANTPPDIHVLTTSQMRSPLDGQPFPAVANAPAQSESLIIGDQFYFQAFVDQATARQTPTPAPLFSTEAFTVKRASSAYCTTSDFFLPISATQPAPTLQVGIATVSGQPFQITAPSEPGSRHVYGVRLRVYQSNATPANNVLFAERLLNFDLTNGVALNQTIVVPGLVAGQKYTAKAEMFNHCSVKATGSVTLSPPVVTLNQPASDVTITAGTTLALSAQVTDDVAVNASSVKFVVVKSGVTEELATTGSGAIYSANWTPTAGVYTVAAKASDNLGLQGVSTAARTVTVNVPPTVSISANPSIGLTAPANTSLSATVSTSLGLTGVAFQRMDGTPICIGSLISGSTYGCTWNAIAAGTYSIRARASINGQTIDSSTLTIVVAAPTTVSLTRGYVYDANQRLCKIINPESGATLFDYDSAGNLAWTAEGSALTGDVCDRSSVPMASRIVRSYDLMNRVLVVDYPDSTADVSNTYEADGLIATTSSAGNTWTYQYNKRRMLTRESLLLDGVTFNVDYGFNSNGDVSSLTYPDGTSLAYSPNALGQPTQAGTFAGNISYFPNGAIKQFSYGNGITHVMQQNARQLPQSSRSSGPSGVVLDDNYAFDENGNVTDITDLLGAGVTTRFMTYDGLDRLKTALSPSQWGNATYTYDALDNIKSADQGARQYRYIYDIKQRLAQINSPTGAAQFTFVYNSSGDVVSKNTTGYNFDSAHRLLSVAGTAEYVYDGNGRRVKETSLSSKGASTEIGVYNLAGQKIYSKKDTTTTRNIYLAGSLIATSESINRLPPATTYLHTDSLGSVVAYSNNDGVVTKRNRYAPFGESLTVASGTQVDGLGYTGHVMDADTGLTYMQQRYYDPVIGRFLSQDPALVETNWVGNFNRYAYVTNNPYKFFDPDGRELKEVNLPGLGDTYLDDAFSPKVETFISNAKTSGVDLTFNSAYRTPEKQADLKKDASAITPANTSLHSAGFAVDVNFSSLSDIKGGLTGDEQRAAIKKAASDAGLNWGGDFKKADPPHFYVDPGKRAEKVKEATKKYEELTQTN